MHRAHLIRMVGTYGVLVALAALILFGFLRYDRFLGLLQRHERAALQLDVRRWSRSECASSS